MAGQQICLKWNSFQSNIVTSFEKLWEEEGFVDVTLASDGQCIQAHKVMLSACSPFFRKVFQSNPCQHPVIILQDVHFSELESLLCFVYKGEVNIDQEHLPALLRAAETLQIRGLSGASDQVKEKMGVPKKLSVAPSSEDCVEESSSPPPPAKRQRSAQPSHQSPPASPLALTPTSRPTRPRRPSSSSSVEPEYPPLKTELDDSRSNSRLSIGESMEDSREAVTTLNLSQKLEEADLGQSKGISKSVAPTFHADPNYDPSQASKNFPYPPFPCPFCDRAYTSWGFRRRHIKAVHTQTPRLSCKWCLQVLPSHGDWEKHVVAEHSLSNEDAHHGLLILEEAHMVLQIPNPTRLDTFVDMIKKSGNSSAGQSSTSGTEAPSTDT